MKLLTLISTLLIVQSQAQTFLGDPNGETTLLFHTFSSSPNLTFGENGVAKYEFGSDKISVGSLWQIPKKYTSPISQRIDKWVVGADLGLSSTNGFKTVLEGGDIAGDSSLDLYFGFRRGLQISNNDTFDSLQSSIVSGFKDGWWTLRVGATRSRYTLLDFNNLISPQPFNEYNNRHNIAIHYNFVHKFKNGPKVWSGIAIGHRRVSNYSTLEKRTFVDSISPIVGGGSFAGDETVVRDSNELSLHNEWYANADFFFAPKPNWKILDHTLASNLLIRSRYNSGKVDVKIGVGLYIVKSNDYADARIGVTALYDPDADDVKWGLATKLSF